MAVVSSDTGDWAGSQRSINETKTGLGDGW